MTFCFHLHLSEVPHSHGAAVKLNTLDRTCDEAEASVDGRERMRHLVIPASKTEYNHRYSYLRTGGLQKHKYF